MYKDCNTDVPEAVEYDFTKAILHFLNYDKKIVDRMIIEEVYDAEGNLVSSTNTNVTN